MIRPPRSPARRRRRPTLFLVAVLLLPLVGCARHSEGVPLTAPFNDETEIGAVTAVWQSSGEGRAFAAGVRLKEPEVRFQYRVDVKNRMEHPMFVRLGGFQLLSSDGLALGADEARVACTVGSPGVQGVLSGSVWIAKHATDRIGGFTIRHFAVPLNERGRALYREFLLTTRPAEARAIDAEIAAYAAAPGCGEPVAAKAGS
jgi:hypothetical protein